MSGIDQDAAVVMLGLEAIATCYEKFVLEQLWLMNSHTWPDSSQQTIRNMQ